MNDSDSLDRNLVALIATIGVFLLFLLVYFFPRTNSLNKTREAIEDLEGVRQEVSVLLPEVARTSPVTPIPEPDVRSWVSANALTGIEKNMVANDSYLEGKGAQIKLRRLTPEQASKFLSSITRVRLVVERMQLEDGDKDGRWDLEINLKVPD